MKSIILLYIFALLFVVQCEVMFDCANSTHEWQSEKGSCFDESEELPMLEPTPNKLGRFLGGMGHKPRDGICGANQTACWVVNCCQPGEICGALTVGCIISWSTIYTTTTGTMWSTVTDLITPATLSRSTTMQTSTAYLTSTTDVTVSGAGLETVYQTSATTITTLILSAYTPITTILSTETTTIDVLESASANTLPATITDSPNKKRGAPEKRTQRTSYTTLTVFVTEFSSTTVTATVSGSVATVTQMVYTTLTAVQTNQHYSTTAGFTTAVVNSTATVSSFAFGTLSTQTLKLVSTRTLQSSSAVLSSTEIAAIGKPTATASSAPSKKHGLSAGAIAGVAIGVVLLLILLLVFLIFCCCHRRRGRERVDSPPLPPSPPLPMAAVNSPTEPTSRPLAGYVARPNGRKSSRASIVSVSPVPEEADEDEYNSSSPENGITAAPRRNSADSTRSWGKGYGGRGGYGAHGRGGSVYQGSSSSPGGNRQFRGVMTSTYSDRNEIPPHERL